VLVEYYGATEGGIVAMIDAQQWERHPGSVGRPLPRTTVTIVDSDGRALPPGTRGRVFVERATRAGFEYHNDPSKTRAAHLRPGVYTFGELGHLDDEGYLYLDGRDDDTIVSGGVNIYPAEVVAALLRHPAVVDVAVFARPDAEFGQVAAALVMTEEPDHERLPAVLREHCTGLIAGFKVPRMWWFTRELPRDETGKLRHATIREFTRAHAGRGRLA
jgi:long-chain acyl-CoA synthetase